MLKTIPLAELTTDPPKFFQQAEGSEVVVTDSGRPIGVWIGFEADEDLSDYLFENDPRFLARMAAARESIRRGEGTRLEDFPW